MTPTSSHRDRRNWATAVPAAVAGLGIGSDKRLGGAWEYVTLLFGHMEKQETEMKRKLETEMQTKDAPITGAIFSL